MSEPDVAPLPQLRTAAARTAELIRSLSDASAPVPGLSWTVGETAAHLVAELRDYADALTGADPGADEPGTGPDGATGEVRRPGTSADAAGPAERNALANAGQLTRFPERDLVTLAGQLERAAADYVAEAGRAGTGRFPVSNGMRLTVPTMTRALLGEQLVHGLDLARSAGLDRRLDRADALQVVAGVMTMVPDYLDPVRAGGLRVSYELRFRGGPRYRLAIEDGRATLTGPGEPVDCWISADPAAFLLTGFGRSGQWSQILRGRIVAGGRRPWLGMRLGSLITGP